MERLTERETRMVNSFDKDENYKAELYNRLAAYEEAEERGFLVRLPCKVGDTVYYVDGGRSYKAKATAFRVNKFGLRIHCWRNFMGCIEFDGIYGITVFLTREEAEAALAKEGDA